MEDQIRSRNFVTEWARSGANVHLRQHTEIRVQLRFPWEHNVSSNVLPAE